ncbi:hypothetical protein KZZ52_33040 [Dactylosporangium sp. AC04546]|uniref:hypothetical protein n=1 Tax=Dactylosporangium sp. AC04546 TaxID=2862460 RepID=UPI001EDE9A5B|nr:hypothetical protein [Dactylosporangium sp. AC04546]WVK78813.1 hypothetical protein KZZ52_33040 [Dactylosporangium sp. AC04546]
METGHRSRGISRAHQVPLPNAPTDLGQHAQRESWMRSYRPEELFGDDGALDEDVARLAPTGNRRMSANPHAGGGLLLRRPAPCPTSATTR